MSLHFLVHFEPKPGCAEKFREELRHVIETSRTEEGCLAIHAYEAVRDPVTFAIHSQWMDEAAFELHSNLPNTVRFLRAAEELLTHPVRGLRSREIGGGDCQGGE